MVTLKDPASFAFAQTTEPPRDDMSGLESHVHVGGKWKRSISRLAECTDCAPRIRDRFDLTLEWIPPLVHGRREPFASALSGYGDFFGLLRTSRGCR